MPMVADGGAVVLRNGANATDQIRVSDPVAGTQFLATSTNFSALGAAPGISDDGSIVSFYGNLTSAAAAALGLQPGAGIFVAIKSGAGWVIQRVAGVSGNGILDPGETVVLPEIA